MLANVCRLNILTPFTNLIDDFIICICIGHYLKGAFLFKAIIEAVAFLRGTFVVNLVVLVTSTVPLLQSSCTKERIPVQMLIMASETIASHVL